MMMIRARLTTYDAERSREMQAKIQLQLQDQAFQACFD